MVKVTNEDIKNFLELSNNWGTARFFLDKLKNYMIVKHYGKVYGCNSENEYRRYLSIVYEAKQHFIDMCLDQFSAWVAKSKYTPHREYSLLTYEDYYEYYRWLR